MARSVALKMKPDVALRAADQGVELAKKDRTKLEQRLPAGAIDGLAQDAGLLAEKTSGSVTARAQKKASTQKQNVTGAQVRRRVMAMRSALQRTGAESEVLKAAGVGRKLPANSVKAALAAADMLIVASAKFPDAMREAGVLSKDVETLTGLAGALRAADSAQEGQMVAAKLSTAERKTVQRRVEATLMRIIAAAELEFVEDNPERVKQYQALVPSKPKKKKPAPQ
jgi:hypothetical protein